ncbi:unnamed protein product [Trichobilharzia szidati]|nr:unnamed protein product [Trichobilharzia szidati]
MNTVVQPIPLPIKVDSVFRAEKSTARRSQDSNNSSLSNNTTTTNNNNNSLTNNAVNKTRVTKDDSRRYLSELDSVIKELCEANEAAVQATREAAQRRQRLGWPSTNNNNHNSQIKLTTPTPTNETKIMPIPNSTNA